MGWGGVYGVAQRATDRKVTGTVCTFAVTAKAQEFVAYLQGALLNDVKYDPAHVQPRTQLYVSNCVICHGVPGVDRGGNVPNLGYSATEVVANLDKFLFKGTHVEGGMPDFTGKLKLKLEEIEKLKRSS